jgi:Tfp pilus assembly protein FimT
MFFMALIAGLTTPFIMSTLDRMEMQSAARKVASALRFARSEAITIKKPVVFSGNITQNHYWVSDIKKIKTPRIRSLKNPIRLAQFLSIEKKKSPQRRQVHYNFLSAREFKWRRNKYQY